MSTWPYQGTVSDPTPYDGIGGLAPIYQGYYPWTVYDLAIGGKQYEDATRRACLMIFSPGWGCGGFATVPIICQRMGDEMPFRRAKPLNDTDARMGTYCTKCMKWTPARFLIYVDGKPYCDRHAPTKRYPRPF